MLSSYSSFHWQITLKLPTLRSVAKLKYNMANIIHNFQRKYPLANAWTCDMEFCSSSLRSMLFAVLYITFCYNFRGRMMTEYLIRPEVMWSTISSFFCEPRSTMLVRGVRREQYWRDLSNNEMTELVVCIWQDRQRVACLTFRRHFCKDSI